jgi:hypothetical protein
VINVFEFSKAKVEAGAEKPIRPLVLPSRNSESLANLRRGTHFLVTENEKPH